MINEYFPELEFDLSKLDSPTGILCVSLHKNKNSVTGHQWFYKYFDGVSIRTFCSYDLVKLRNRVLSKGFDWIINDNKKAIDSYKLNSEFLKVHDAHVKSYHGTSGVLYVSKWVDEGYKRGYCWMFNNNKDFRVSSKRILELREKVLSAGHEWKIMDEDLFRKSIECDEVY